FKENQSKVKNKKKIKRRQKCEKKRVKICRSSKDYSYIPKMARSLIILDEIINDITRSEPHEVYH
ncbi:38331_t:CDS:1, partial [Gigaspora margarita]